MKIVAKAITGKEFLYNTKTAHKVSARSCEKIVNALNDGKFMLPLNGEEIWHVYDVDEYDKAYFYAARQEFVIRNGYLCEKRYN